MLPEDYVLCPSCCVFIGSFCARHPVLPEGSLPFPTPVLPGMFRVGNMESKGERKREREEEREKEGKTDRQKERETGRDECLLVDYLCSHTSDELFSQVAVCCCF